MSSRIDESFLDKSTPENAYRLETFQSTGTISAHAPRQLRCYFVTRCNFPPNPPVVLDGKTDIRSVSDSAFLDRVTQNTLDLYQQVMPFSLWLSSSHRFKVMWSVERRFGPVLEVFEVEGTRERKLVIGFKMGSISGYFRWVNGPGSESSASTKVLTYNSP